jgi:predicted O-methyltransferase YrrM
VKLSVTNDWPPELLQIILQGIAAFERGDADGAATVFRLALRHEPNIPEAHLGLALSTRPGPDYLAWLSFLHRELSPRTYLEIGIEYGTSLALAAPQTRLIGIDPSPQLSAEMAMRDGLTVHAMTSDAFASDRALWPEDGIDFAFIDGDHRFEQGLRDFIAVEAMMAPHGVIALHDTWPLDAATAAPERRTGFYTGDSWKIVPCLRALRPDLRIVTLPAAPSGLTLVTNLDPASDLLRSRLDSVIATYSTLPYTERLEATLALWPAEKLNEDNLRTWLGHDRPAAAIQETHECRWC